MLKTHSINFSLDQQSFCTDLSDDQFDILSINNATSTANALELISTDWFKSLVISRQNLLGISFKLNKKFKQNFNGCPKKQDFRGKETILVAFESSLSNYESKIYWRVKEKEKFSSLEISEDENKILGKYCMEFIVWEIKSGRTGILPSFQTQFKITIRIIGNKNNSNLLIIAAQNNEVDVLQELLKQGFDVDYENSDRENAIECAWLNYKNDEESIDKSDKIILSLLNANSQLPRKFEYEEASTDVQEFVISCESLHAAMTENNFEFIRTKIKSLPNLCHFYNRFNQSLMAFAIVEEIWKQNEAIIPELISNGVCVGFKEDLAEIYKDVPLNKQLRNIYRQHSKELPKEHLFVLRSKCKIGYNDRNSHDRWRSIEDMLSILDSMDETSKVLRVAATYKKLTIYFDFMQDTVYYLDPTKDYGTRGVAYSTGSIYIGAKDLTDENLKFDVFGVFIHELCHLAVNIAYVNNFDPYPNGESVQKLKYEEAVEECDENQEYDDMFRSLFKNYEEELYHSELIVLVVQILAQYFVKNPEIECENSTEIKARIRCFGKIFKYFKEVVEHEFELAIPVLKKLEDTKEEIKFKDLTESMKAKVLHTTVIFQGVETSFSDLVGNNPIILNILDSKKIRGILQNDETLVISHECKSSTKYKVIDRKFIIFNTDWTVNQQNFESVVTSVENSQSRMLLLSDTAGAGKTTTFECLTLKLKKKYKNFWVSFIKLREHQKIFLECEKSVLNIETLSQALLKVLKIECSLEVAIYEDLFKNGKVILLFDGVDEISPTFNELIVKILEILRSQTNNQYWISTRPQHAKKLEEKFDIRASKLATYDENERKLFISAILDAAGITDETERSIVIQKVSNFVHKAENKRTAKYGVKNPLMIEIITELCIQSDIDLDLVDFYDIFEKIIVRQKLKVDSKIPPEDRDAFAGFNLQKVHQVYALKLIFGDRCGEKISKLSIMRKWESEKHKFTTDSIQRYGFLNVNIRGMANIDFIHRIYAEFFVTEFILDSVFDESSAINVEEFGNIFAILKLIVTEWLEYYVIYSFLLSYLQDMTQTRPFKLHMTPKQLIISSAFKISGKDLHHLNSYKALEIWSLLLRGEPDILKKLWKVDRRKNLLKKIFMIYRDTATLNQVLNVVEVLFGADFYEVFRKYGSKLIKDDEIEVMDDDRQESNKKMFKFLDLIDKNYEQNEKNQIFRNYFSKIFVKNNNNVHELVLVKFLKVFRKCPHDEIAEFLIEFIRGDPSAGNYVELNFLIILCDKIEKIFKNDEKSLREILFYKYWSVAHPLLRVIKSKDREAFNKYKTLYMRHKYSWNELQEMFLAYSSNLDGFPSQSEGVIYEEVMTFIKKIFSSSRMLPWEFAVNYYRKED